MATGLFVLALLALQVLLVLTRVHLQQTHSAYDPRDDTAFYWAESSLQYRHARMVAHGESIPSWEQALQHPEGVHVFRDWTVAMEYPTGWSWRLLRPLHGGLPFHVFTIWSSAIVLSLAIWPVAALGLRLFESRLAGLWAAVLYGLSTPATDRLIGFFARDHFALPFLFAALAFFVAALDAVEGRSRRFLSSSNLAGACFAVALSSWHFSRFVHLLFVAVVAALVLLRLPGPAGSRALARCLAVVTAWCAVAALLVPVLRAKGFLLSPGLAASLATVVVGLSWIRWAGASPDLRTAAWRRLACWAGIALPLVLLGRALAPETGSYGHVYSLFLDKLRFLLQKPADPTLLSMESRLLWLEAFNSPSLTYALESFGLHAFVIAVALGRLVVLRLRVPATPGRLVVLGLGLCFLPLFAMVHRLSVFLIVFAALGGGLVAWKLSRRGLLVAAVLLVPVAGLLHHELRHLREVTPLRAAVRGLTGWEDPSYVPLWIADHRRLVRFVAHEVPEDSVIAARAGYGPILLTHADRAVALQPKWEAEGIRRKTESYLRALYGTEDELAAWCLEQGVDHVLLDVGAALDEGPEGDRYAVAEIPLRTDRAAFRLHFAPETLRRFEPIHQSSTYRLFRVVDAAGPDAARALPWHPVYDLRAFGGQRPEAETFDDRFNSELFALMNEAARAYAQGQTLLQERRPEEAARHFEAALRSNPALPGLHGFHGVALLHLGRVQEGLAHCRREVALAPLEPLGWRMLGICERIAGRRQQALEAWREAERLDPGDEVVRRYLDDLLAEGP